ncbi:hypothetical protein LV779_08865 [Streptomyces thinghirensis]|nr:hypothetical protein [Streptomyces thinghirensis]
MPARNLELIRDGLGTDADVPSGHDGGRAQSGRDHPRGAQQGVRRRARGRTGAHHRRVRRGRAQRAEYPACAQHEALINAAFAGRSATIRPARRGRAGRGRPGRRPSSPIRRSSPEAGERASGPTTGPPVVAWLAEPLDPARTPTSSPSVPGSCPR